MRKRNPFKITSLAVAVSLGSLMSGGAQAVEFSDGDFSIQLDTTLSVGAGWRTSDIDYDGVSESNATAAGETDHHDTGSQDNSNLRYEQGETYTEIVKLLFDIEMNYKNFGAFVRVKGWYDNKLSNNDGGSDLPAFYPTTDSGHPAEPRQSDTSATEILDAFIWGDWWIGEMPLNVRYGRQVISWGEGVFFPNGINTINAIDVNALLAPGSELKEALLPTESLFASIGVTENLSLEAFVQFDWEEIRLPSCGTFFSTTDLIGDGCVNGFYVGFEAGEAAAPLTRLPRGEDRDADDNGQWGFAVRYFIEPIETEVAGYFINYHSKLPLLSGVTPTLNDSTFPAALNALSAGANAASLAAGGPAVPPFGTIIQNNSTLDQALTNNDLSGIRDTLIGAAGASGARLMAAMLPYAEYVVEYPEDIQLFGVSFSTTLNFGLPGGASSFSGEFSVRKDQPFQIEDGVLLSGILGLPSQICADAPTEFDCYSQYGGGEFIQGFIEEDYYQGELSVIHFFDRFLGAERWTAIFDIAYGYADIPDNDEILLNSGFNAALVTPWYPENAQGWNITIPTIAELRASLGQFEEDYYPTKSAWGYKFRFTGEYSNVFAGINLKPSISFSHDVNGVSPGPISNFLEDRMSFSANLEAIYQNTYSVAVGYTDFFGAEPYNQLADRDFFTLSASVSF